MVAEPQWFMRVKIQRWCVNLDDSLKPSMHDNAANRAGSNCSDGIITACMRIPRLARRGRTGYGESAKFEPRLP